MDALQQHMLDAYRAGVRAEPVPPPPGLHDRSALRSLYRHWLTHPPTPRAPATGGDGAGPSVG
ncbi:hypothetical protein [Streptomyces pratensis]|uniref:hypothetical protein n=1 Tax=Streptomyces pratensis TaxID=1169025 RepID=UPI003016E7D4